MAQSKINLRQTSVHSEWKKGAYYCDASFVQMDMGNALYAMALMLLVEMESLPKFSVYVRQHTYINEKMGDYLEAILSIRELGMNIGNVLTNRIGHVISQIEKLCITLFQTSFGTAEWPKDGSFPPGTILSDNTILKHIGGDFDRVLAVRKKHVFHDIFTLENVDVEQECTTISRTSAIGRAGAIGRIECAACAASKGAASASAASSGVETAVFVRHDGCVLLERSTKLVSK